MKFIPYEVRTGAENMRIDEALLEEAIREQLREPVFRLYGWSPACVSLGRNQSGGFLNVIPNPIGVKNLCRKEISRGNAPQNDRQNFDVVRRLTGGRALLHDDEITYSIVCPQGSESVAASYRRISQILVDAFALLGIALEFGSGKRPDTKYDYCMLISTGADLCYEGKKLIGSAQLRKQGYILQHGSVLYDYDPELLEAVFNEPVHSITCVKAINPRISREDVIDALSITAASL